MVTSSEGHMNADEPSYPWITSDFVGPSSCGWYQHGLVRFVVAVGNLITYCNIIVYANTPRTTSPCALALGLAPYNYSSAPPSAASRNSFNPSRCVILGFRTGFYPP
eukprot:2855090-Prymnesium_polylepis.1